MKKVLLGMSGGVDSSVAAVLLKEAGYEVIGATMLLCKHDESQDAKRVCDNLGIKHYTIDCTTEFKKYVIDDFIKCYQCTKTPNPCVECNKHMKFGMFYKKAMELGCDYIATGHYVKKEYDDTYKKYVLKKSNELAKDQSYFLYGIPKEVIPKIIFPLQDYKEKNEKREIAKKYELEVANKKESQEICFIPNNNYAEFLLNNMEKEPKKGNIVTTKGEILGEHNGLIYYTIGQRKGLGIAYKEPLYVLELDNNKNEVIVGTEDQLYKKELYANELNFLLFDKLETNIEVTAKIRFRAKETEATVIPVEKDMVKVEFKAPQRAITKGQSVVFYKDDIVIGGGKII